MAGITPASKQKLLTFSSKSKGHNEWQKYPVSPDWHLYGRVIID